MEDYITLGETLLPKYSPLLVDTFLESVLIFLFPGMLSRRYGNRIFENDCRDIGKNVPAKVVACYYTYWSKYRPDEGQFNITNIDPMLCTHAIYTFAGLDAGNGMMSLDYYQDVDLGSYKAFNSLKEINPCLKTILAIGGWNDGSMKYSIMVDSPDSRKAFTENALRFLVHYGFDGLDIDWEYPARRGGLPDDRQNFVLLLESLATRLHRWGLELSVAVAIGTDVTDCYDFAGIGQHVDHIFLMAYDVTSATSTKTGLNAPMSSISKTIDLWKPLVDPNKLVLGLPAYARTFTLKSSKNQGLGAESEGPGTPGTFTQEAGFLSNYELMAFLNNGKYKIVPTDGTYYAYYQRDWYSFDLADSYEAKVKYAINNGLGGLMVWSIDNEDFLGQYNNTYPILNIVKKIVNNL